MTRTATRRAKRAPANGRSNGKANGNALPTTAGFVVACAHCGTALDIQGFTLSLLSAVGASITGSQPDHDLRRLLDELRPRERQVLQLVADGWQVVTVAERLGITENTVRKHLQGIYRKVGVRSKAELLEWLHAPVRQRMS